MPRKKQPAPPVPRPRPTQQQNGGRKPSPGGPGIQVQTRLTRELLARLNSECERMEIDRSTFIRDSIFARLNQVDRTKAR